MKKSLFARFKEKEHAWRDAIGSDISTPEARRRAQFHFNWIDHGILRVWWKNFHRISEGVYRANQPSPARLAEFRQMGIKTILNLRGTAGDSHYLFEREACDALGLHLIDHRLYASGLASRAELLELIALMEQMEKPVVMHCKSGADRTGFAAVIYLHIFCDVPLEVALDQLNWRYLHFRKSKNGILDLFFAAYLRECANTSISLRAWIENRYDPATLHQEFARKRNRQG